MFILRSHSQLFRYIHVSISNQEKKSKLLSSYCPVHFGKGKLHLSTLSALLGLMLCFIISFRKTLCRERCWKLLKLVV